MRIVLIVIGVLALTALGVLGYAASRPAAVLETQVLEERYLMAGTDRYVTVDGARVRVREEGPATAPVIVLIHGFAFSLESWDAWAADLASDYRVIRYDLLGHGLTGPDPQQRYAPPQRAAFLGAVLDALGVEQAVLAGNSLGGTIAWRFAAMQPERVSALALVDAGVFQFNEVGAEPIELNPVLAYAFTHPTEAFARQMLQVTYADAGAITDARVQTIFDMASGAGVGQAWVEHLEAFTMPDPSAALAQITAPTLVMWGEADALIPVDHVERIIAGLTQTQARGVTYPGVGHAPQEEAPEPSVADLRAWLAEVL